MVEPQNQMFGKKKKKYANVCFNSFTNFFVLKTLRSFGIVLMEIITLGEDPYPDMTNKEVVAKVPKGYRMPKPEKCPEGLYDVMQSCWTLDSNDRPDMKLIYQSLYKLIASITKEQDISVTDPSKPKNVTGSGDSYENNANIYYDRYQNVADEGDESIYH